MTSSLGYSDEGLVFLSPTRRKRHSLDSAARVNLVHVLVQTAPSRLIDGRAGYREYVISTSK